MLIPSCLSFRNVNGLSFKIFLNAASSTWTASYARAPLAEIPSIPAALKKFNYDFFDEINSRRKFKNYNNSL